MTLRLLSFICTVTAASLVASCGGGAMSGGADAQKGKKSAESDEDATDPQVIAGAYLTCDYTSEANTEVGCNLGSSGKNITPTKSERIDYVVQTGATEVPPTSQNASYNAVFSGLKNTSTTTFLARLYRNSTKISEWSCDGSKLPCTPAVKRTAGNSLSLTGLNGKWIGQNSDDYVLGKTVLLLYNVKPAPADDYCDDRGRPVADAKKVKASGTLDGFLTNFTGLPPPKIINSDASPHCVRKINGQIIRTGTKCSVVVARRGPGKIHDVLVYPKDISETSQKELAGLNHCP